MSTVDKTKTSPKSKLDAQKLTKEVYNNLPYTSYPFEYTRPEKIASVGSIFGLNPPPIETARILELGCASGGNIIRFAETYPKAYCLGVDLAENQVKDGQETVKKLGLKNIELKAMSLTDLTEKAYGKFDYIISHGVFSWVPDFVQDSILEISNKMLNKNGISFISYNALPGWNMTNTIRQLMLYHSQNFPDINDKITQSRAVLAFLQESLKDDDTPHGKFMQEAAKNMATREDNYIYHEYLEPNNKAIYLNEFVTMANKHQMNYLGDINIASMSIKHMPKQTAEKLQTIGDMAKTEQYADFIKNTPFKCSLIVHKDVKFSHNFDVNQLDKLYYYSTLVADVSGGQVNIKDNSVAKFLFNNDKEQEITTTNPIAKASLLVLASNAGNPMLVSEIAKEVKKLLPEAKEVEIKQNIFSNFVELILVNYISYLVEKPKNIATISKKPKISNYALLQSKKGVGTSGLNHITNALNHAFAFDDSRSKLIQSLDGTRDIATLKKEAFDRLKSGEITAMQNDKRVEDEKQLQLIANSLVDNTLEQLRSEFCLIA